MPVSSRASLERDTGQVGVAVAVTPGLEPALELAVVEHHHLFPPVIDHQGGAGEVAGPATAVQGVRVGGDEVEDGPPVLVGGGVDVGRFDVGPGDGEVAGRPETIVSGSQEGIDHGRDTTGAERIRA